MGYCMSMSDSTFYVPSENVGRVLALMRKQPYGFQLDDDGNITDIEFLGEKLGDELTAFEKIAPYVRSGSFLKMHGEDDERWRWVFKDGKCREVQATVKVTWEE